VADHRRDGTAFISVSFYYRAFQTDFGVFRTAEWKRMLATRRHSRTTGITTNSRTAS
jgi:hypothetical protein